VENRYAGGCLSKNMILEIAVILIILWALGFSFNILGGLIHILLVVALAAIVWNFITGRKVK
jgi:uncharacterized protein (DUF58 family)